jgi:hypothetical protein
MGRSSCSTIARDRRLSLLVSSWLRINDEHTPSETGGIATDIPVINFASQLFFWIRGEHNPSPGFV